MRKLLICSNFIYKLLICQKILICYNCNEKIVISYSYVTKRLISLISIKKVTVSLRFQPKNPYFNEKISWFMMSDTEVFRKHIFDFSYNLSHEILDFLRSQSENSRLPVFSKLLPSKFTQKSLDSLRKSSPDECNWVISKKTTWTSQGNSF